MSPSLFVCLAFDGGRFATSPHQHAIPSREFATDMVRWATDREGTIDASEASTEADNE